MTSLAACRVRVPCTTSNLGAGFDCLGLALDRYLEASFEPGGDGLRLERSGTLAELDALDVPAARDRLAAAFTARLEPVHGPPNGVLRVTSEIPVAKGLGSSAAATIAGLVLARAAAGGEASGSTCPPHPDPLPPRGERERAVHRASREAAPVSGFEPGEVAGEAVAIEGHPDNVGAALLGGLVFARAAVAGSPGSMGSRAGASERERTPSDASPLTLSVSPGGGEENTPLLRRLPLSAEIGFAFAAPPAAVDTADARAMLPPAIPFALAARSVARVGALLYGLAHADPECLRAGFGDELHVPHRLPRIPGGANALAAACEAGAWAATISGSGSGLIAACPLGTEAGVADAMSEALRRAAGDAIAFPLRPETHGMWLTEE